MAGVIILGLAQKSLLGDVIVPGGGDIAQNTDNTDWDKIRIKQFVCIYLNVMISILAITYIKHFMYIEIYGGGIDRIS